MWQITRGYLRLGRRKGVITGCESTKEHQAIGVFDSDLLGDDHLGYEFCIVPTFSFDNVPP